MTNDTDRQIQRWRRQGFDCLGPSATEVMLLILDGHIKLLDLARMSGLSPSAVSGHVRRIMGLGLVKWTCLRGDPIVVLSEYVDTSLYEPIPYIPFDWTEADE